MIVYLVKSTILLGLLWGLYALLLQNEKMHRFNRFYLLIALLIGLTAPLIQFEIQPNTKVGGIDLVQIDQIVEAPSEFVVESIEPLVIENPIPEEELVLPYMTPQYNSFALVLILSYIAVAAVFLFKFVFGLNEIYASVKKGKIITWKDTALVLMDEAVTPQSFLKWIFLNREDYESGKISDEILEHERTHIKQKHSLDVLFIEALKVVFWFNPFIYGFRNAILLNHEFLADEHVVTHVSNRKKFQETLLEFATTETRAFLSNKFSRKNPKMRIVMLFKSDNKIHTYLMKLLGVFTLLITILLFSNNAVSQTIEKVSDVSSNKIENQSKDERRLYIQYHPEARFSTTEDEVSPSPFVDDFLDRLVTYNTIESGYKNRINTDRDLLYQRVRLVYLHQRLHPFEQLEYLVPDMPEGLLDDLTLTNEELAYQNKLIEFLELYSNYEELPKEKNDPVYLLNEELITLYENLSLESQQFIVDNLPPYLSYYYMAIELEEKMGIKTQPPLSFSLSRLEKQLAIHYLDESGNTVSTTVEKLSKSEREYLIQNTRKSAITQVYPLPFNETPTESEWNTWKDSTEYKILIDKSRFKNSELDHRQRTEFHHAEVYSVPDSWNIEQSYEIHLFTYPAFDEMVAKYRPSQKMIPLHESILIE